VRDSSGIGYQVCILALLFWSTEVVKYLILFNIVVHPAYVIFNNILIIIIIIMIVMLLLLDQSMF
jgi:hypothetical protein